VARVILIGILLIIVARMFWRLIDGVIEGASGTPRRKVRNEVKAGVKLQRDPVCGTFVTPGSSLSLTAGGTTRYFCSEKCRNEYLAR
jgi:YHS domain-containing protein